MAEVLPPPMRSSMSSRPSSADQYSSQPPRMYRVASAPIQPYAFQSTPTLRQDSRGSAGPNASNRPASNHKVTASTSTTSSDTSSLPSAKDDTSSDSRPPSLLSFSSTLPDLTLTPFDAPVKPSPDRYRRPAQKRVDSASSSAASRIASPLQAAPGASNAEIIPQPAHTLQRQASMEDMSIPKPGAPELAKRYRRRSLNQLETQNVLSPQTVASGPAAPQRPSSGPSATSTPTSIRPVPMEDDGIVRKANDFNTASRTAESASNQPTPAIATNAAPRPEQKVNVPPRASSDNVKRMATPSPLSQQPSDADSDRPSASASPPKPKTYAQVAQSALSPSPAAQQLAAVSDRDLNKGMKSKLRRAFSFGSAQELRRTAGQNNQAAALQAQQAQQVREQHQAQIDDGMDAEQLEIARRQEAAGIGAGIYSGQGGFTGSTDNLSISSTASSASMMLRKMGRGAKKGARSVKSLFRPKSVIGVPAADGPVASVEPSIGQISMVTVEAERQNVNVNIHPDERTGGGTGFPKLERNSLDAAKTALGQAETRGSADTSDSPSRRSVVGSDKDRAEVLAAVKKGILKRQNTGSPDGSPVVRPNEAGLGPVPQISESPLSSLPSTPKDGPPPRSSSAPNVNHDYFGARMAMVKTMPSTPNGSMRSISFSPKISFHDVWSSTEYDRRGEIATCNRLTPMLAQQIKEELNTFKMEMEVHEMSKPHTHFF